MFVDIGREVREVATLGFAKEINNVEAMRVMLTEAPEQYEKLRASMLNVLLAYQELNGAARAFFVELDNFSPCDDDERKN